MTYKQIVDNIKQIVDDHKMLADFGYGQISDIKNGADDTEADYPYAFLNPGSHTRGERMITYRFNLIVMDMYLGDDFLQAQSDCQQYIDDILAELKYNNKELYDTNINATLTPFKERFQDVVGGMTATIDIEVPQKLNLCIAPFNPTPELVLDVQSNQNQLFRPDLGESPQRYPVTILDTYNGMRPDSPYNYYDFGSTPSPGTWTFTERGTAVKVSGDGTPFNKPRVLTIRYNNVVEEIDVDPTTSTFPADADIGVDFDYVCTWTLQIDPAPIAYIVFGERNEAAVEPQYETYAGVQLTGTYTPNA